MDGNVVDCPLRTPQCFFLEHKTPKPKINWQFLTYDDKILTHFASIFIINSGVVWSGLNGGLKICAAACRKHE